MAKELSREARKRQKWMNLTWIAGVTILVIVCLRFKQVALLYFLATIGVTVLLLIVGMADLKGAQKAREL